MLRRKEVNAERKRSSLKKKKSRDLSKLLTLVKMQIEREEKRERKGITWRHKEDI